MEGEDKKKSRKINKPLPQSCQEVMMTWIGIIVVGMVKSSWTYTEGGSTCLAHGLNMRRE